MSRFDENPNHRKPQGQKFLNVFFTSMTTNHFFRERIIFFLSTACVAFMAGLILGRTTATKQQQQIIVRNPAQVNCRPIKKIEKPIEPSELQEPDSFQMEANPEASAPAQ